MQSFRFLHMKLDHVAIAVNDFDETVNSYKKLFGVEPEVEVDDGRGLKIAIFHLENVRIEVMTPIKEDTAISKFLKKRGNAIHHIALKVNRIEDHLKDFPPITPIERGITASRVVFLDLDSTHRILIELVED